MEHVVCDTLRLRLQRVPAVLATRSVRARNVLRPRALWLLPFPGGLAEAGHKKVPCRCVYGKGLCVTQKDVLSYFRYVRKNVSIWSNGIFSKLS